MPITSALSPYSLRVHPVTGSVSETRPESLPQVAVLAWPSPRLWPNSCATTSTFCAPLTQIREPRIEPSPVHGQSRLEGKYTRT